MPKRLTTTCIAALAAAAVQALPAQACSLGRAWLSRPPVYFIATALPDTALAGAGPVRYEREPGRAQRPIHGQVAHVERIAGDLAPMVTRAWNGASGDVVLVPWSYTADCRQTLQWGESARWVSPGTRGLFTATLRDSSQWVAGRPTFDVRAPFLEPYPAGEHDDVPPDSMMSADEVFDFLQAVPPGDQAWESSDPYAALAPLLRWAREHPGLARRYPASAALADAYEAVQPCVTSHAVSPVAGTYRLSLSVPGEPTRTAYIRTSAHQWAECSAPALARDPGRLSPRMADSYHLYVHKGMRPDSIPAENSEAWTAPVCPGVTTMTVWDRSRPGEEPPGEIAVDLDATSLLTCFRSSAGLKRVERLLFPTTPGAHAARTTRGVVRRLPGGRLILEQTLRVDGELLWRVQGERVSQQVLAY